MGLFRIISVLIAILGIVFLYQNCAEKIDLGVYNGPSSEGSLTLVQPQSITAIEGQQATLSVSFTVPEGQSVNIESIQWYKDNMIIDLPEARLINYNFTAVADSFGDYAAVIVTSNETITTQVARVSLSRPEAEFDALKKCNTTGIGQCRPYLNASTSGVNTATKLCQILTNNNPTVTLVRATDVMTTTSDAYSWVPGSNSWSRDSNCNSCNGREMSKVYCNYTIP